MYMPINCYVKTKSRIHPRNSFTSLLYCRRVIGLETELYGIKASTAYIKDFINDLKSQRKEKQKADDSLQSKYRMIQQFETEAVSNFCI